MKYVVGIGNPGRSYDGTRHNIGFRVIDTLDRVPDAVLVKPATFVNRTGEVVKELAAKQGAKPEDILIVCDDVNLDFGKIRLRPSGSAGGHHGLESVIEALGSEEFARLRFGVRNDGMPADLAGFVLEKFSKDEQQRLPELVRRAVEICRVWVEKGFEDAQRALSRLQSTPE